MRYCKFELHFERLCKIAMLHHKGWEFHVTYGRNFYHMNLDCTCSRKHYRGNNWFITDLKAIVIIFTGKVFYGFKDKVMRDVSPMCKLSFSNVIITQGQIGWFDHDFFAMLYFFLSLLISINYLMFFAHAVPGISNSVVKLQTQLMVSTC